MSWLRFRCCIENPVQSQRFFSSSSRFSAPAGSRYICATAGNRNVTSPDPRLTLARLPDVTLDTIKKLRSESSGGLLQVEAQPNRDLQTACRAAGSHEYAAGSKVVLRPAELRSLHDDITRVEAKLQSVRQGILDAAASVERGHQVRLVEPRPQRRLPAERNGADTSGDIGPRPAAGAHEGPDRIQGKVVIAR